MRVAYLDCFAGIAGDMFLGALIDAGVPLDVLHAATAALNIHASLQIETVDRSGISSIKVHVLENGRLAETAHISPPAPPGAAPDRNDVLSEPAPLQHVHPHPHPHDNEHTRPLGQRGSHGHAHVHGRSLTDIRNLIQNASLHEDIKSTAIRTFTLLGQSEAKIHNVPVEQIHFHEVGAVDAIVDIVATCAGIHHLQIGAWYSSALNVGSGMVRCAHGVFPVPAPATADLLRGAPTYSAHLNKELVTPTGAALLRALEPAFGEQPAMTVNTIGYGAGTRNPEHFPNVLRLTLGTITPPADVPDKAMQGTFGAKTLDTETVAVLETALDDASPQLLAYVAEQALAHGALDVMLTPVLMKKGRPGTLITVLSTPKMSETLQQLLLRETPTLGVRIRHDQRICLDRKHVSVATEFGAIRIKLGHEQGEQRNAAPEFEDCKAAALQHDVPLKQVQQAAIAAFYKQPERP